MLVLSCSDSHQNENCKYLVNAAVSANINLNLPSYSQLQYTSNSIYIPNQGNKGIIIINVGSHYRAWDAADPNHEQNTCSLLTIKGVEAVCGCSDANTYNLYTGGSVAKGLPCGLKEYRVIQSGNFLEVFN